ncbi:MAG: dihydrodipicolinate reductase [Planctomycetota bacterium]
MTSTSRTIRVAQFGLGPIGLESLRLLASMPWADVVGGVDIDPLKQGLTLSELCGEPALGEARVYDSFDALAAKAAPDVVLHTAGSNVEQTIAQILPMVEAGVCVATTCEPMLYPWLTAPRSAEMLDAAAEVRQVSVVGTGVNPGFVMDMLPVVASGVMHRVDRIDVLRVVDASTRRMPLQRKVGSGMVPAEFEARFAEGKAGHAGFRESVAMIAASMGWPVEAAAIRETLSAVVADQPIETEYFHVEPGQTRGLHQVVTFEHEGQEVIKLDLTMALAEPNPRDVITLHGQPDLTLEFPDGVAGDTATVAALVNCIPRLLDAKPGVRLMTDLAAPVRHAAPAPAPASAHPEPPTVHTFKTEPYRSTPQATSPA